jgi:hypothetical protein
MRSSKIMAVCHHRDQLSTGMRAYFLLTVYMSIVFNGEQSYFNTNNTRFIVAGRRLSLPLAHMPPSSLSPLLVHIY